MIRTLCFSDGTLSGIEIATSRILVGRREVGLTREPQLVGYPSEYENAPVGSAVHPARPSLLSFLNSVSRLSMSVSILHSQMVATVHPRSCNPVLFLASRLMLASNFEFQNSRLDAGRLDFLQPCWCQKHP